MIVVDHGSGLRLVTQGDHARLAAEILALWRTDGLPEHPRRDDLLFAVREHDNGWAEADAAPSLAGDGSRPHDFLTLPSAARLEIWERGTERYAGERPYATLLIIEHALALHRGLAADPAWAAFLDRLTERRALLLEDTEADPRALAADYRWLSLADSLSLLACDRRLTPPPRPEPRIRRGEGRVHLEPFPLAGATTFRVPCREIPLRHYSGDAELGGRLAEARWTTFETKLVPWQ